MAACAPTKCVEHGCSPGQCQWQTDDQLAQLVRRLATTACSIVDCQNQQHYCLEAILMESEAAIANGDGCLATFVRTLLADTVTTWASRGPNWSELYKDIRREDGQGKPLQTLISLFLDWVDMELSADRNDDDFAYLPELTELFFARKNIE